MAPTGAAGTGAEVTVREAAAEDTAAVAELSRQLGYPASAEDMARRMAEISADDASLLLVADRGGVAVAWVLVQVIRPLTSDLICQVAGLVVHESCRGKGIGALLMREAERWARERGCRGVMLRSRSTRERAHGFYRRLGYSQVKTQEVFLKEFGS